MSRIAPDEPPKAARRPATDPIDWDYLEDFARRHYNDIIDHYFRARLIGAEKLEDDGPLIIAPNHSGNAFPHDGVVLDALLWRRDDYRRDRKFRTLFTPKLAATWWMRPYGLENWWRRGGGVDMSFANYDRLLARGERVMYFPEGVPGIGKGFTRRYRLRRFHSSFVVLAARHGAPVYPVSAVNAEWVNPASITFKPLDRLSDRLLNIPFLPLPIAPLALVLPFLFYFAFPSRMVFVFGDPIDVRQLLREESCSDVRKPDRASVVRVAERVREIAQSQLDEAVAEHGTKPYDLKGLVKSLGEIPGKIFKTLPFGWPFTYLQHERDWQRPPAEGCLHALLRDLDIAAYYVPFGWVLIALSRLLRQPPYGHRGLSREEQTEREGRYHWDLGARPLPPRGEDAARENTPEAAG